MLSIFTLATVKGKIHKQLEVQITNSNSLKEYFPFSSAFPEALALSLAHEQDLLWLVLGCIQTPGLED